MHSYIHRILDTKDPPDAEEIENPYKWILIVELVIFLIHFYICTKDSVKYKQKYTEHKNEGTQFKFQLTQAIGLGSLVRAISLILMVMIHTPTESNLRLSFEYLFITFPCFVWLPVYFAVINFFVKINYIITGQNYPQIQPLLKGLFWASIIIYVWFFLQSFVTNHYDDFVYDASWLIGLLYIVMSLGILLFGQKILWNMKKSNIEGQESNRLMQSLKSVQILTYLCAIVFILRGFFSILTTTEQEVTRKYLVETLHIWHGLLFLISELVPVLAITYLTKEKSTRQATPGEFELEVLLKNPPKNQERPLLSEM